MHFQLFVLKIYLFTQSAAFGHPDLAHQLCKGTSRVYFCTLYVTATRCFPLTSTLVSQLTLYCAQEVHESRWLLSGGRNVETNPGNLTPDLSPIIAKCRQTLPKSFHPNSFSLLSLSVSNQHHCY